MTTALALKTIHLHGFMGKKYGKTVKLAGANMYQLMSGLTSRFGPQFKEDVRANNWHIIRGKLKNKQDIGEEELELPLNCSELHLVPAVTGSSATLRIVIGVVLIIVGAWTSWAGGAYLIQIGVGLVIGGVTEMLTKQKKDAPQQKPDDKGSFIYNGVVNVTSQGGPVPLIYGRVTRASSVLISTDFSSDDIS